MPRTATALAALLAASAAVAAGCSSGEEDEQAPAACLAGSAAYVRALASAPGEARLQDETPISDCLTPEQEGGQLAAIGAGMIKAATDLNVAAQRHPGGAEALRLGYLVGAVERGSEGIHADLVRRLNAAARYSPEGLLPPEFERSFGRGYAAGLESG